MRNTTLKLLLILLLFVSLIACRTLNNNKDEDKVKVKEKEEKEEKTIVVEKEKEVEEKEKTKEKEKEEAKYKKKEEPEKDKKEVDKKKKKEEPEKDKKEVDKKKKKEEPEKDKKEVEKKKKKDEPKKDKKEVDKKKEPKKKKSKREPKEKEPTEVEIFIDEAKAQNVTYILEVLEKPSKKITGKVLGEALIHSAKTGQEVPLILLEAGAYVNVTIQKGITALHHAAKYGHVELVEVLIEAGADVDALTNKGESPLIYGSGDYCNSKITKALVDEGASLNLKFNGKTALKMNSFNHECTDASYYLIKKGADHDIWDAVHAGHLSIVKDMVNKGINFNATRKHPDHGPETVFVLASYSGHAGMVTYFIKKLVNINILKGKAMSLAARYKKFNIIEILIEAEAEVPVYILTDLMKNPDYCEGADMVKLLFKTRANIHYRDSLFKAVKHNCTDIVKAMAKSGHVNLDSVNEKDIRLIGKAVEPFNGTLDGRLEIVQILVNYGAEADIYVATYLNNSKMVRQFIAEEVNVDEFPISTPTHNKTSLYLAASLGHVNIIEILIKAGADLERYELSDNRTALMAAAQYDEEDAALALIKAGANINAMTDFKKKKTSKYSVLMISVMYGSSNVTEVLIDAGAKVDYKNTAKETVSMLIAGTGSLRDGCFLVMGGADVNITNRNGETAYDIAVKNGEVELAELFGSADDPEAVADICAFIEEEKEKERELEEERKRLERKKRKEAREKKEKEKDKKKKDDEVEVEKDKDKKKKDVKVEVEKEKENEKEKEKEKDKEKENEKDKEKEKEKDKEKEKEKEKDKEKKDVEIEVEKEKEKEKDKEKKDVEIEVEKEKEKEKEKDKEKKDVEIEVEKEKEKEKEKKDVEIEVEKEDKKEVEKKDKKEVEKEDKKEVEKKDKEDKEVVVEVEVEKEKKD